MEINKIKILGAEIYAIFQGEKYLFYSPFYGLICTAERTQETASTDTEQNFIIYVGNHHTTGGRLSNDRILTAAKRYINASESQFIEKRCNYTAKIKDLANAAILISYKFND